MAGSKESASGSTDAGDSKTDANGGAIRKPGSNFFNDEEAWIQIYYTLLLKQATLEASILIPPTTDILLSFNAYFQGFKEPIGRSALSWNRAFLYIEGIARPIRTLKQLTAFEAAVQLVCPELEKAVDILRQSRSTSADGDGALARVFNLFVTPEQIKSVLSQSDKAAALDNLTFPNPVEAATISWQDKGIARIDARRYEEFDVLDYEMGHWKPEDLPARSLHNGPQMARRHEDAAYANTLLNACPIPPLGFFGDMKELKEDDFSSELYVESEKNIEQNKHKEQMQMMELNKRVVDARWILQDLEAEHGVQKDLFVGDIVRSLEMETAQCVKKFYQDFIVADMKSQTESQMKSQAVSKTKSQTESKTKSKGSRRR